MSNLFASMFHSNFRDQLTMAATPDADLAKLSIEENGKSDGAANNGTTATNSPEFKEQFKAFSKFGDTKSDGKLITLSQSDKWMKQAKVIDKKITTTDTAIHFKKLKSLKVSFADYNKFLDDLATTRKVDLAEIKNKLATCGAPGVAQITNVRDIPLENIAHAVEIQSEII